MLGTHVYVEVTYYFGILLHILKLAWEYLSMLHQPDLLTPKSGLWEKLIACSQWHQSHVSDKVAVTLWLCALMERKHIEWMHEWMNECTPGLFILSSGVQFSDVSINASSGNSVSVRMSTKDRAARKLGGFSSTQILNSGLFWPQWGMLLDHKALKWSDSSGEGGCTVGPWQKGHISGK
jgi:hypothetical protein